MMRSVIIHCSIEYSDLYCEGIRFGWTLQDDLDEWTSMWVAL